MSSIRFYGTTINSRFMMKQKREIMMMIPYSIGTSTSTSTLFRNDNTGGGIVQQQQQRQQQSQKQAKITISIRQMNTLGIDDRKRNQYYYYYYSNPINGVIVNKRRTFVWHAGYENMKDANVIRQQINQLLYEQQNDITSTKSDTTTTTTKDHNNNFNGIQKQLDELYKRYETITGEEYSPDDDS